MQKCNYCSWSTSTNTDIDHYSNRVTCWIRSRCDTSTCNHYDRLNRNWNYYCCGIITNLTYHNWDSSLSWNNLYSIDYYHWDYTITSSIYNGCSWINWIDSSFDCNNITRIISNTNYGTTISYYYSNYWNNNNINSLARDNNPDCSPNSK